MSKQPVKKEASKPKKRRFSARRYITPPVLGALVMVAGFGVLNSQWIMAQALSRMHISASNQYLDVGTASAAEAQNKTPTILIPGIKVDAPIITDVTSHDEADIQLGLRRGVLHYPGTSMPGESGNVVLFGHSSGAFWRPGNYKFVFTLLNTLKPKDLVMVDYDGKRYIYRVTDTKVVPPTDFSVIQQTKKSQLTLITCTPVGTSKNRLIVHAEQIFPHPVDSSSSIPLNNVQTETLKQLPN